MHSNDYICIYIYISKRSSLQNVSIISSLTGREIRPWISCKCNSWSIGGKHYSDVTMSAIASQITSLTIVHSTLYSGVDQTKTSMLHITGLCAGNSPAVILTDAKLAKKPKQILCLLKWDFYVYHYEINCEKPLWKLNICPRSSWIWPNRLSIEDDKSNVIISKLLCTQG